MEEKKTINKMILYFPDARVLTEDEISKLSPEKKETAAESNKEGLWLEIDCPDGTCLDEKGQITIPSPEIQTTGKKGTWLNFFCPERSCEILQSTDAPS